jgi:hypothetical protein
MSAGIMVFSAASASADPSASAWSALRQCESTNNYAIDTGNGYYGAYQFDLSTWQSVGGSGSPADASPAEQDYRALYLYRMRGWSPWACSSIAGLREDSSAGSGVVPTRADSAYIGGGGNPAAAPAPKPAPTLNCHLGAATAPAWGGVTFSQGHTYRALSCWQKQMATRGYHFTGTGYFGSNTFAAVHDLQSKSGIPQGNVIDARTWNAAWSKPTPVRKPAPAPKPAAGIWPGLTAAACHVGAAKAPAWPGVSFRPGAYDRNLACWQMQMGRRGYPLTGVGYYGAHTLAAAKDIELRNGMGGSGLIGPGTWKAAWQGKAKA